MRLVARWLVCALVLGGALGACVPINVDARVPTPNVIAPAQRVPGRFSLQLPGLTVHGTCAQQPGLRDLCIMGMRAALARGLEKVLGGFLDGSATPRYQGTFRMLTLHHHISGGQGGTAIQLKASWQFTLVDPQGHRVVQIAETTSSPYPSNTMAGLETTANGLLTAIVERVHHAFGAARWPTPRPAPSPAVAPPAKAVPPPRAEAPPPG